MMSPAPSYMGDIASSTFVGEGKESGIGWGKKADTLGTSLGL